MADATQKFAYASEVLMITLCGMIIASGVINMEQFQRVDKVKGTGDEAQKNADYQAMANTWYGIDTAMGAVLGALILAMMTYQLGKPAGEGKGFTSSVVLTYIFSFFAYAVIVMNSAFGLNVYKTTASWKPKGHCPGQPATSSMRYKAMMAARARAMGQEPPKDAKVEDAADAAKYAEDVNKTNIAFISISSTFFAIFLIYLGYNEAQKRRLITGGMRSQFLVY